MNTFEWTTNTALSPDNLNEMQNILNNNMTTNFQDKGTVLWTNVNPSSSFGAQTITLDESLDNYAYYEIIFRQGTTTARLFTTGKIPVGYGTILQWNTASNFFRPTSETVSGSTITFEKNRVGSNDDNTYTIPYKVLGYKV